MKEAQKYAAKILKFIKDNKIDVKKMSMEMIEVAYFMKYGKITKPDIFIKAFQPDDRLRWEKSKKRR